MSVEENMALARRLLEAHFKGDLDAMDEMMTPEFVSHTKLLPDQEPTREGQKWAPPTRASDGPMPCRARTPRETVPRGTALLAG
jgi:ketosteroid isomerase-like protein